MTINRSANIQALLVAGVLCCLASSSIAQERTLTPEQRAAISNAGVLSDPAQAKRPGNLTDLTKGERIGEKIKSSTWNLGPTGIVGYMVGGLKGDQIQAETVIKGSPADGKIQWGDVILGINGKTFVAGGQMGIIIGNAIIEAEKAENKGILKLRVWRDRNFIKRNGKKDISNVDIEKLLGQTQSDDSLYDWKSEAARTKAVESANFKDFPIDAYQSEVVLNLAVMPPYSDTSPYDCPKAAKIRENAWKVLEKRFVVDPNRPRSGRGGVLEALALVASGKPEHRELVRQWVRSKNGRVWHPPQTKDDPLRLPGKSWYMSFQGLDCAIYYDATGDKFVLPALRRFAIRTAMGQAGGGSWGHGWAQASFNGGRLHGMNPGYGALNASGNRCFFLIALAQKLGIKHPEIDAAVKRSRQFFGSYTDKGAIPYGFHPAASTDDSNGKNTGVAYALKLIGDSHGAKYFAQMSTHASFTRRGGHGNDYFWHWSPWAATLCGPEATIVTMRNMRWWHTLCRCHDGSFVLHSPTGAKTLRSPTATYVLHYSAPLKQTIITGKDPDKSLWLTKRDMSHLIAISLNQLNDPSLIKRAGTPWQQRSTDELFDLLDVFMPKVRRLIASELAKRYQVGEKEIVPRLGKLLDGKESRYRGGACRGLAACGPDASLQYLSKLARLLKDPKEFVRMQAVQAISKASTSHETQLALLKATVDEPQQMSMPPNNVRTYTQSPLFKTTSKLAESPFQAGFEEELVQKALERLIELDPMGNRGFLATRQKVWSKDTVIRLAGPLVFVAEDKQVNDQMFGGGRHLAGRTLLGRFGYREYFQACAGPLLKNAAIPRHIRPKVTFKIALADPDVIRKTPAACHELLDPFKLCLADDPLARIAVRVGEKTVYTNIDDLMALIKAEKKTLQPPSISTDVNTWFRSRLARATSKADKVSLCRAELKDPARKNYFRQMAAMDYLVEALGLDATDDIVALVGHDYWRVRRHAQEQAAKLAANGGANRLIQRFAKANGKTAAGILAVLASGRCKAGLKLAQQALGHEDPIVRKAAVQAVFALGGKELLNQVFTFMLQAKEREDLRGCEKALLSRRDDPEYARRLGDMAILALPKCGPKVRDSLYWLLAQLGGQDNIAVLRGATATRDDAEFLEIVNAISYSPDSHASQTLLSVIKENLGTKRAEVVAGESVRRMVIGSDDIGNLSNEQQLDFAEPLLKMVRNPKIVTYLGHLHSGRSAQVLQRCMRLGGVTSIAAQSIIAATKGMENAPKADRKLAVAALIDAIEYIEVTHIRGGGMANDPKSYAVWKALSAQAGKNLLNLDKPGENPIPEFDDTDLDL